MNSMIDECYTWTEFSCLHFNKFLQKARAISTTKRHANPLWCLALTSLALTCYWPRFRHC